MTSTVITLTLGVNSNKNNMLQNKTKEITFLKNTKKIVKMLE